MFIIYEIEDNKGNRKHSKPTIQAYSGLME